MRALHISILLIISAFILYSCDSMTGNKADMNENPVVSSSVDIAANASTSAWYQGFETDAAGWLDADDSWYGDVTRVSSGTNGITSSEDDYHAIFSGDASSAPFTRFDGYRDTWTGEWIAEIDIYLDPSWPTGSGFDYSVAANGSDGAHQRDYIFHVGVVENEGLIVNGSNNTDFTVNSYKLLNENGGNYGVVSTAGWYTLQHRFYDDGGSLSVDLTLLDTDGNVLFSATRSNAGDLIPAEVGGNRYGWFTVIDVANGIHVDAHELYFPLPDPETKDDCKKGGWEDFGFKNQGQCIQFVNTGKDSR